MQAPPCQPPARASRNAAISWRLRTTKTSPTIAGWLQVLPSTAGNRASIVNRRRDQRKLASLRQHQQQVLIGQQHELAGARASALPHLLAVLDVDARKDAAIEAERMAFVNDQGTEGGLQPGRRPALLGGSSAGSVRDRDAVRVEP